LKMLKPSAFGSESFWHHTRSKTIDWNLNESALFAFTPPDCGLATEMMSGKKSSKFRITIAFACNADGSEKMPPLFIGKYKQPRCFGNLSPQARGFYYQNNSKAWMTSVLFEE
jgi:hypothetical protein